MFYCLRRKRKLGGVVPLSAGRRWRKPELDGKQVEAKVEAVELPGEREPGEMTGVRELGEMIGENEPQELHGSGVVQIARAVGA